MYTYMATCSVIKFFFNYTNNFLYDMFQNNIIQIVT